MKFRYFWVTVLSLVAILVTLQVTLVSAITNGEPDGNDHPAVVLLMMDIGGAPAFRCSGTLLSPTVVLTAGHCTPFYLSGGRIFTESDVDGGDNNYPLGGGNNTIEALSWTNHPLYPFANFLLHDVGVVVLKSPVILDPADYGVLPSVDQLDALKDIRPRKNVTFTAVGYGLQSVNPKFVQADRVRTVAHPFLQQINTALVGDYSLMLSNSGPTGGTCTGDSGGPNYLGDSNMIAGITSYGLNNVTCEGGGGVFRLDRQDVLDFVNSFLP